MSIIISDLHLKKKTPYYESYQFFLRWLIDNYNDEVMVFLGDVFDTSAPQWEVYDDFKNFLYNRKNETHILSGNHDISTIKGNSVYSFRKMEGVSVYKVPETITIENHNCLMLPFLYTNMKEEYEKLDGVYDFIFTHVTTPETAFGEEGLELKMKGTYLHGHTHTQLDYSRSGNQHYVIGCPYSTRHGEQNQNHRIAKINDDKSIDFIPVPQYFTFRDVEYGDDIKEEWKNDIINIQNAPSVHSVHDKYKGFNIRETGITLKEFEGESDDAVFEFSEDALQNYFNEFKTETELGSEEFNTIMGYLDK